MPIGPGTRLGAYEVVASLGTGGMGEVYRARDSKLNRDVAIKLLPSDLALDPDRLARFRREAQVLASLNHSNIGAIYGFEDSEHVHALVLELVEGPTLADRIARGPIPLDDAIAIARQIADAFDAAHQQGIVHRDLKPANVKLRPDGTVKVLDFGLAKAVDSSAASGGNSLGSPTITSAGLTRAGVILGTAAYMSPEQARGQSADQRSDVWAFGCVLYEMLTGDQLFRGETITDLLAAVVSTEPDLSKASPRVYRLLRACLAKDNRHRLRAIGDAWLLLDHAATTAPAAPRLPWAALLTATAIGIVALAATGVWMRWRPPPLERRPIQFQVNLPEGVQFLEGTFGGGAISPDGQTIAFVAISGGGRRLWLRRLDSLTPRELPATTGADFPFWSPDGRSIGFFAEGKLKRVDSSGGQPLVLAEAPLGRGGSWGPDGTIIFGRSTGGLRRVSAAGGQSTPLTKLDLANGENAHRWPQFLPDGRRFLYFVRGSKPNRVGVYASTLDRPEDTVLVIANSTNALYAALHDARVGYLLWARESRLVAQMFDPERAQLSGETTVIAGTDGVGVSFNAHRAAFSLSQEGTLMVARAEERFRLEWFGRNLAPSGEVGGLERYAAIRLSPDGGRVAVALYDSAASRDIWTMQLPRGLLNRLTDNSGFVPVWSPDGQQIAYHDTSQAKLFTIAADGTNRREVLDSQEPVYINDWSPDGRSLLYSSSADATLHDLWRLPLAGDRKPEPWLVTPFNELHGQYSPDGKWVAFTTDDSGQQEIYLRGFDAKDRIRVSSSGGSFARWRADGKELFYRAPNGRLMAVPVSTTAGRIGLGTPVALIDIVEPQGTFAYPYDVSPDGQRILTLRPVTGERGTAPLTVLVNWDAGLKR